MGFTSLDLGQCHTAPTIHLQACRSSVRAVSSAANRAGGGVALQGESQTRCRVMSWKVFCFVGRQALFPVCFQRGGRRGRKRRCVTPCGKSTWAAAEEPRCDKSRAKSFKTFSRFVFPITGEQQKSDSSEVSWPPEAQKNLFGCLILSCRL